jgi:hypothetical protein
MMETEEAVAEVVRLLAEPSSRADDVRDRLLTVDQLANLPQPSWLAADYIMAESLGVLYGKPGSGKTFVALDLACSVATGTDFLGHIVTPGRVLYVAGEAVAMFHARVSAWKQARGVDRIDDLFVYPGAIPMLDRGWVDGLAVVALELNIDLVILDTLNRCLIGGDENSPRDMGAFVDSCATIQQTAHTAVLVVHHDSRAGGAPRGHSSLDGAADAMLEVTQDADGVIRLRNTKQKDAPEVHDLYLKVAIYNASCALDHHRSDNDDKLSETAIEMLRCLHEIARDDTAATGVWLRSSEVAERTFYRWAKRLVELDYCHVDCQGSTNRYGLTDKAKQAIAS